MGDIHFALLLLLFIIINIIIKEYLLSTTHAAKQQHWVHRAVFTTYQLTTQQVLGSTRLLVGRQVGSACKLLASKYLTKATKVTTMVSYGNWNPTENGFLITYHPSLTVPLVGCHSLWPPTDLPTNQPTNQLTILSE